MNNTGFLYYSFIHNNIFTAKLYNRSIHSKIKHDEVKLIIQNIQYVMSFVRWRQHMRDSVIKIEEINKLIAFYKS